MTANTGNSFNPETTTVGIEISAANLGYSITASSTKTCPNNRDNDRQPEM